MTTTNGNGIVPSLRIGGVLTFWSLSEFTSREELKQAWTDEGFEEFVPEPRAPSAVLKDALAGIFASPRTIIRALQSKDGWAVVQETRGQDDNSYSTMLTAKVDDNGRIIIRRYSDGLDTIKEQYERHMGLLRQCQVSNALVAILGRLGASSLRPKGGLYGVPESRCDEWRRVARAAERCGLAKSAVYMVTHLMDADAIRAIKDAIVAEVLTESQRINKEIAEQDLGNRALETRRTQAQELREKVLLYEELLGAAMPHLHRALAEAEEAAARAAILVAAEVA